MAEHSNIEWTDHTFNPWIGCQKVGPGCDHCYAEAWDARGMQGLPSRWGAHADRTRTSAANWRKPLAWDKAAEAAGKRARVFCASLADVFDNHPSIQDEWRRDLWALIRGTPNLDWLLLTKRPGNIPRYLHYYQSGNGGNIWPNVWLGCTVVNQAEADRDIPKLLAVPAKVRFLSIEPMLGPIDLWNWIGVHHHPDNDVRDPETLAAINKVIRTARNQMGGSIDWIICGGESGKDARPMHPAWARYLRDQCVAAGVPYLFKQWGNWDADALLYTDMKGRCPPPDMNIGKKVAGRLLDGRTWDEVPA